jgi:hypothetical protein
MAKMVSNGQQFKARAGYFASGELEERITSRCQGTLVDNVKILNDIQEEMYAGRCQKISTLPAE